MRGRGELGNVARRASTDQTALCDRNRAEKETNLVILWVLNSGGGQDKL
jgi:hypothetical protein